MINQREARRWRHRARLAGGHQQHACDERCREAHGSTWVICSYKMLCEYKIDGKTWVHQLPLYLTEAFKPFSDTHLVLNFSFSVSLHFRIPREVKELEENQTDFVGLASEVQQGISLYPECTKPNRSAVACTKSQTGIMCASAIDASVTCPGWIDQ